MESNNFEVQLPESGVRISDPPNDLFPSEYSSKYGIAERIEKLCKNILKKPTCLGTIVKKSTESGFKPSFILKILKIE